MNLNKLPQTLRVMFKFLGYALIVNCILLSNLHAAGSDAQVIQSVKDVRVNLQFKNAIIKDVFKSIENQTEFSFTFKEEDLRKDVKVNASYNQSTVADVLTDLSKVSGLKFKQINESIHVVRMNEKKSDSRLEIIIQKRTISGKVLSDEDGQGLPGVNVIEKGTTNGAVTDIDGEYTLSVSENAIIVFSSIGYATQEIEVGTRSVIDLTMTSDVTQLDELVVTGYGTQIKSDITGAISSVDSKKLSQLKSQSFDAALQGQAAGVQVTQAGGVPGAPVRVMVRGTASISADTEPLWIIDGIPLSNPVSGVGGGRGGIPQNPLATINPNDIESIEILKDAAATAIYGSRGTNGVIIVTTKTGKGSGEFNIDISSGVSNLTRTAEDMGYVNGTQWLQLVDQARANSGLDPLDPNLLIDTEIDPSASLTRSQLTNTNWFDQILTTGSFKEVNLSTSKGFDKGGFYISTNYRNDEGVMKNNNFTRFTTRANLDYQPIEGLTSGLKLNLAYTKNERVRTNGGGTPSGNDQVGKGGFGEANGSALPIFPIRTESGAFWNPTSGRNVAASIDTENQIDHLTTYRAIGGIFFDYKLPFLSGLSLRTEASFDLLQTHNIYWASALIRPNNSGYAFDNNNTSRNLNYNLYATYNKAFGKHFINAVVGTESQEFSSQGANIAGEDLRGAGQQVGAPGSVLVASGGFGGERYLRGHFARLNYRFNERYLLGLSFRRDGSSVFQEVNRLGNFPAFSAGWILSEENFMQNLNFVSFLKVRGSYGQTGNQSISASATETTFLDWPAYGNTTNALLISNLGSTDLTWETTESMDFGVDFGFFNDRINGSVGYYRQDVTDLLFRAPIPQSAGLQFAGDAIWTNVGDMRNEGFEFSINSVNFDKGDFSWTTSINFSTNRNQVLSFNPELDAEGSGVISGLTYSLAGGRIGAFYLAEHAGVDPETGVDLIYQVDQRSNIPVLDNAGNPLLNPDGSTITTSNPDFNQRMKDTEGNYIIIPAHRNNVNGNRRILKDKSGLPTFFGGFTNTFRYQGFELLATFSFQGGNYIYDSNEESATFIGTGGSVLLGKIVNNTWTPDNTNALYPQLRWNRRYNVNADGSLDRAEDANPSTHRQRFDRTNTTRFLHKGDFMRLRTLQVSYTFENEITSKLKMQGLRVYAGANNLFTFTKFEGWDPELANFNGNSQVRNLEQGVFNAQIPTLKTLFAGVNITF